jgi:pyruvate,water dikinase
MQRWIRKLDSQLPASLVGRKAAALSQLIDAGFPVPTSLCITTDAFRIAAGKDVGDLSLPEGLLDALSQLLSLDAPFAVRSSAVQEDRPDASLAGRYSTCLNVIGAAALEGAILDCWRSYSAVSPSESDGGMAVLIQPLIDAECAGVCFTVDPVRLQPDKLLVVSGWGLGTGVVSGAVPTDTARIRRQDLQAEAVTIANKHTAMRPAAEGGVIPVPVSSDLCTIPCLPDSWLQHIGQYGLTIEQLFGAPQDIEWAIVGGQVWILQSRPVTALPGDIREAVRYPIRWENTEEKRHYWWLSGARDSAGTPLLSAELDFTRINLKGGQDAVYYGGFPQTRWLKEVNGRTYMTVAKPPHSSGHTRVYGAAWQAVNERLQQNITPWEYWGSEIIAATERLAVFDPRDADGTSLAEHLEDAIATATRHWMLHTGGPRPIRDAELLNAYARILGRPPADVASEIPFFLTGAETIQTRLVETLYNLARLAQEFPEEAKAIVLHQAQEPPASPALVSFTQTVQHLFAEYGGRLCYRKVPGYPVELPLPWREAPEHVWDMISAYLRLARQGGPSLREVRIQARHAADQRVESICAAALERGTDPGLVKDFLSKLDSARRKASSLDDANHYIDQLSEGQFMQALLHAGRWLAAQRLLSSPFDVFWLSSDEVLTALRGTSDDLAEIIATRRSQFVEWQMLLPPPCLGLPTPQLPERPAHSAAPPRPGFASQDMSATALTGEPASRGYASGRARVSTGETLPADITPGDMLVAPFAGPVLIPLLPSIAAVVLDYGGPGDHFAITAREFGLPAVCGTLHATRLIPDGAQITIDANSGLVTWT